MPSRLFAVWGGWSLVRAWQWSRRPSPSAGAGECLLLILYRLEFIPLARLWRRPAVCSPWMPVAAFAGEAQVRQRIVGLCCGGPALACRGPFCENTDVKTRRWHWSFSAIPSGTGRRIYGLPTGPAGMGHPAGGSAARPDHPVHLLRPCRPPWSLRFPPTTAASRNSLPPCRRGDGCWRSSTGIQRSRRRSPATPANIARSS